MDTFNVTTASVVATTPVVLRIMPLLGSPAPIGYIYDPTPACDGDGGLLAAASAFFSHQGHQVILDPCPDLAAYRRAGGVTEPIIDVDRLPDHVLSAGLDLLESSSASSKAMDALGLSFMAAYLLAPAPVAPQGLVSLSPMGGDTAGQPFSALSSTRSGGSEAGGRSRSSFHPASPSSRSVTHLSPTTPSRGDAHRRPDPEPCEHVVTRVPSYGSGRAPFIGSPRRVPSSVGYGGRPGGHEADSVSSSPSSYGRPPHLGGGSNSSDYQQSSSKNSSFWGGDLSVSSASVHNVPSPTRGASVPSLTPLATPPPDPIPLPIDRFTLPPIKTTDDYLAARDLIFYWLRRPGFSSARSDGALATDPVNALASQFWEGQLRTALKDGPARFLFENTGATFYDKGFEMLQVLEDNFRPSSISNTFTTLLSLFNDRQSDKEGIHEFRSRFEGHFSALSRSSVAIPQILQVMLFLRALHLRYQDLLNQFASKQKDLSVATIDSVVADAKFMDEFVAVGANGKAASPSPSPRSPAAASANTDREGKEHRSPWEWLASYGSPGILSRWRKSLRGGFYLPPFATQKRSIILSNTPCLPS